MTTYPEPFPEQVMKLTYEPLPWQTHPIDIAKGSQGWGPMNGPYTPFNFPDLVSNMGDGGINITWLQGEAEANKIRHGPGYSDLGSIFTDNATSFVNNQQNPLTLANIPVPMSSTITQHVTPGQQMSAKLSLLASLKNALLGGKT